MAEYLSSPDLNYQWFWSRLYHCDTAAFIPIDFEWGGLTGICYMLHDHHLRLPERQQQDLGSLVKNLCHLDMNGTNLQQQIYQEMVMNSVPVD
ncbi:unnamed protein product [Absidia cylindrospora]